MVPDGRRSILVVEDEAVVADDLQHRLVELGYEVAGWAVSGEDAVRLDESGLQKAEGVVEQGVAAPTGNPRIGGAPHGVARAVMWQYHK